MNAFKKSLLALSLIVALPAFGDASFNATPGTPIPYKPFKIQDFCRRFFNGNCQETYQNASQIFEDKTVYDGTVGEYVNYLNTMEQLYAANGHTLHPENDSPDDEINHPMSIPTSAKDLEKQLLMLLNLNTEQVLESVLGLDMQAECSFLPLPGRNIEDPNYRYPLFSMPGINDLPLDSIISRFNEFQHILCPLGQSLYAKLDPAKKYEPEELIHLLMEARDKILAELGLSQYAGNFSMESVQQIQAGIDIAQDIMNLIEAQQMPSPEQLFELRQKLNDVLPEDWDIPDVPNIPSPVPPTRRDLELKKRKDWSGFNYGERDRFATYANAYLELRGSEDAQQGTAFGAAGVYILNHEINAIGGYAAAYAGPDEIYLKSEMKAFGQEIMPKIDLSGKVQILKKDPKAFSWEYDPSYEQTFMAGPIPVTVGLGARLAIGLGYDYGVYTTQLKAGLIPFASAEGYAWGEAGIPKILSAGAAAEITILDARIPLSGFAGVKFDEVGYPYLRLGVDSKVEYTALQGRAYAFANYVVPRWGMPPWKKKRAEYDIFNWKGHVGEFQVMNWGIEFGRNGTKLTGDLLDQTDRLEAAGIADAIDLEERTIAMADFQTKTQEKVTAIFNGMKQDLESPENLESLKYQGLLKEFLAQAKTNITATNSGISEFFQKRSKEL